MQPFFPESLSRVCVSLRTQTLWRLWRIFLSGQFDALASTTGETSAFFWEGSCIKLQSQTKSIIVFILHWGISLQTVSESPHKDSKSEPSIFLVFPVVLEIPNHFGREEDMTCPSSGSGSWNRFDNTADIIASESLSRWEA